MQMQAAKTMEAKGMLVDIKNQHENATHCNLDKIPLQLCVVHLLLISK